MRQALKILVLIAICLYALPAAAADRVALIIGNSNYRHAPYLPNPTNDALDIAASFEHIGFSVRVVTDANFDTMRRALLEFAPQAQSADIAVVFFAGHGMEVRDENWLIPVDAEIKMDAATGQEAISLASIMPIVGAARKLGLVMLDACRDNPFSDSLRTSERSLGARGLAAVEPPGSVMVMFAAKHGTTAGDGAGRNSPFSTALLHNLETPGLEVNYLFRNVHDEVSSATQGRQEPFVYGTLSKEPIYLKPVPQETPAVSVEGLSEAGQAWAAIKDTDDPATLQAFIDSFGSSFYATLAQSRLRSLSGAAIASAAPSPSTSSTQVAANQTPADSTNPHAGGTASPVTGAWSWHARCGLLGDYNGTMTFTEVAPGRLRFDASDGWSAGVGQIHGSSISMRRQNSEGAVQSLALQLSTSSDGHARLIGGLTDSRIPLGSCPWRATRN